MPKAATLAELLEAYFRSDDPKRRASIGSRISEVAGGSVPAVAAAVGRVPLWPELPSRQGRFRFDSAASTPVEVAYQLPSAYDPRRRYPLLVCMPAGDQSAREAIAASVGAFGGRMAGFVVIAPPRPIGNPFRRPAVPGADLPRLMRETRRRIHIDSDRVFLFGRDEGGDRAWMAALAHADVFAGAIFLSSYPHVPYPEQAYPLLLENLREVPVLTVWRRVEGPAAHRRAWAVAVHNRAITAIAKRASLPIVGLERVSGEPLDRRLPDAEVDAILAGRRSGPPRSVSHWFRHPGEGHAAWLQQTRFAGEVWRAEQLSVLPAPGTDRDPFITGVLKEKMAYLGGRVEGQTIHVEVRHAARVDLLLPEGLVDLDRPIHVRCNGKRRFEGVARRRVAVLLDAAYQRWEFQRLPVARLSFSISSGAHR